MREKPSKSGVRTGQFFILILHKNDGSCVRRFWIPSPEQDVDVESCELFQSVFVLLRLQAEFVRTHQWECSQCSSHRSEKALGEENKNNHSWFPKMTNPAALELPPGQWFTFGFSSKCWESFLGCQPRWKLVQYVHTHGRRFDRLQHHALRELQSHFSWKRPLMSSGPTPNLSLKGCH